MTQKASNLLGQTVQTLSNGNYQIGSNLLTPGLTDAQGASNWVLVDKKSFNNQIVDYTIPCDSTVDDRFMINVKRTTVDATKNIFLQLGSITAGYISTIIFGPSGGGAAGATEQTYQGFKLVESNKDVCSSVISIKNGQYRMFNFNYAYISASSKQSITGWGHLADTTTTFNSMRVFSDSEATTCEIEIYKWQETKSVELHSLELVKEIQFTNNNLDVSIPWDGEIDQDIYITGTLTSTSAGLGVQLNNDAGNNYVRAYHWAGSSGDHTGSSSTVNSIPGIFAGYNEFSGNLKKGVSRGFMSNTCNIGATLYSYQTATKWNNSTDAVNTIRIFSINGTLQTGTIRIYKRVKTHLVCQTPGLLQGMWQKTIDNDTIEIQPGSIEINGVVHNQGSKKQITLSGNLRTGETEAANTYYYLYAISGAGRTISYKFSSIAPLMDRFGNLASSFEDCYSKQSWHHPNEGITWRWVGQVYNDASSNIFGFDKCYPGYWEGKWTSINWGLGVATTINHAYGKLPNSRELLYNLTGTGLSIASNTVPWGDYGVTLSQKEYTNTTIGIGTRPNGFWYSSGTWRTTGYYKIVIKE